jgi:hypothetical protein
LLPTAITAVLGGGNRLKFYVTNQAQLVMDLSSRREGGTQRQDTAIRAKNIMGGFISIIYSHFSTSSSSQGQ